MNHQASDIPDSPSRRVLLPPEFEFSHDFSMGIHDWMVSHIKRGEEERLFDTSVELSDERHIQEVDGLEDEPLMDWLEAKGYTETIAEMYLRRLFPGLLSDFLHFVFEALSCSRKQKLTVCYALIRKPFRENLTYMEWLLADPEEFLTTLHNEASRKLSSQEMGGKSKILKRIRLAIASTAVPEMYDAETLHKMRFDKHAHFGFEELWNKATHIVTTKPPIETEKQNLNFLFSNEEDHMSQWYFLYSRLPMLLSYASDVSDALMTLVTGQEIPSYDEQMFRRIIGMAIWSHEMKALREDVEPGPSVSGLEGVLVPACPKCDVKFGWQYPVLRELFHVEGINCSSCGLEIQFRDLQVG